MWPDGFDPERLTLDASLNKLVLGPAPGAQRAHVGHNGADLLGRDAVVSLVEQCCGVAPPPDAVADRLGAALAADPAGWAVAVVDEVGDRLASLIATLRDPATAAAATGPRRSYLAVWRDLDLVMLGGGLMKGVVGERVASRAAATLAAGGVEPPTVRVERHPEWLALLGAARSASGPDRRVVVLDGGQTWIKRGIASVRNDELASVRVFPPVPVDPIPASGLPAVVTELAGRDPETVSEVVVSVAAYVHEGRPIGYGSSVYEQLDPVAMQARLGVPVRLIHDGTAAWRGTGTDARSAVIMLGTWLGVGIGPHREGLRPYAADFEIRTATGHPSGRPRSA